MMLLGPRSSVVLSLSLPSLFRSLQSALVYPSSSALVVSFCLVMPSFVLSLLLEIRYFSRSRLYLPPSSRCPSLSLFLVSEDLLTRGPRVSRRALWWLLRWLLASLESSRECAPRGSRNSLGNRFTSFPTSLHSFSFLSLLLLSPFLTAPRTTANPPYAPSGSYLRVLLIFSYYRRGHVDMFHTYICKSSSYVHEVRSTSRFTGLPPSYSAPFPMFLSSPLPPPPALDASLRYSNM